MAFSTAQRLEQLSVPIPLARELGRQIDSGSYNVYRLIEMGMDAGLAKVVVTQPFDKVKATRLGMIPAVATLVAGGGGQPVLPQFVYEAETDTLASALPTTPDARRKKAQDRLIARGKASGWWQKLSRFYMIGPTEGDWQVNWKQPGVGNLTKNGSPTYVADDYVVGNAITDFYGTGLGLLDIPQNNFSFGLFSKTGLAAAEAVMGAQDANGVGISLAPKLSSNQQCNFRAMSVAMSSGTTAAWDGLGLTSITRTAADAIRASRHGAVKGTFSTASVTPASNVEITILKANGNTTRSTRRTSHAYIAIQALTEAQELDLGSAVRDYLDKIQQGMVDYYNPANDNPGEVTADVVVFGGSMAAVCAAYEAKRQGRTVALVGDWLARSDWDLGGMTTSGLSWIDANSPTSVTGVFREALSWINTVFYGRTDASSQTNLSVEPRAYLAAIRRMLDPSKTGKLPGLDIPVYYSKGLASVQKTGTRITSITTYDGRVFKGKSFIGADYEGQLNFKAGVPYIIGAEAQGTGGEQFNGFKGATSVRYLRPDTGIPGVVIDPYVTPGNAGSGLLPDLIPMPSIPVGDPDPSLQSFNYRLTFTTDATRSANFDTTPPPGYNALRYEVFGRFYAAFPSKTFDGAILKVESIGPAATFDINNGENGVSTDLGQSGLYYGQTTDDAGRKAIAVDLANFDRGYFYWHLSSGDVRIPSGVISNSTGMGRYRPDAWNFLDPGDFGTPYWPNRPYVRDPIYQMKNAGYVHNGSDWYQKANGAAMRSDKTITCASYFSDRHSPLRVAYDSGEGISIQVQGGMHQTGFMNTDTARAPLPLEALVPDKAACSNLLVPIAMSMTKVIQYIARMEPCISLAGQSAGVLAAMQCENDLDIQDQDYATFRTRILAAPDTFPASLPQTF